ncbi:MAG TPA: hypothetical protein VFG42_14565 [Baekduia sp.]|uniref:hypothetical protein n=1 Tax=Baekduia sp. TaxID=2600305 RepID=UPI002D76E79B|nr:hypothetical protein [Baekduia sp.]HET6508010.1 hypothetical protein [Baekduia sp.]
MPCHHIDGCFRGDEVNIGYRPYRTTTATAIRTGRSPDRAVVVALDPGQGLGRQTVRNPGHDDLPADREPEAGADGRAWIWVYARRHGGSGWIPLEDVEPTESPPGRPCRGPAGFDFEPGLMPSKHGPHTTCGNRAHGPTSWRRRGVVGDAYLRWSPDGTAFDYLHAGDLVAIRGWGPRAFACVTVIAADELAPGTGGWVDRAALTHAAEPAHA